MNLIPDKFRPIGEFPPKNSLLIVTSEKFDLFIQVASNDLIRYLLKKGSSLRPQGTGWDCSLKMKEIKYWTMLVEGPQE